MNTSIYGRTGMNIDGAKQTNRVFFNLFDGVDARYRVSVGVREGLNVKFEHANVHTWETESITAT